MIYELFPELKHCTLCPRNCGANRYSRKLGYCNADASYVISSICIHRGEEPAISGDRGICNIFFGHCNLRCIFCQNHQISDKNAFVPGYGYDIGLVIREITDILDRGIVNVGFVSPSHFLPHVKEIITALKERGYRPIFVYNTNAYDKVEELRKLEGLIDVYLPDFKYADTSLAKACSDAGDYPDVALKAISEMYRQVGSTLIPGPEGVAERGLIIRHLVLPGHVQNSLDVLGQIAGHISPNVHISLMSQYYPTPRVFDHHQLGRTISLNEYGKVVRKLESLGMNKGWIQELSSTHSFRPDFRKEMPFGE
ncbi:MAG: radical SAM protein [Bacteroidales bacterium]|nr:radical SAM protein [Bacteroidales bacterium]